ncbi:MAG: carboxypeptidase regulatory-like domain-containing protein, partial [Planctomycetota bacterium]
TYAPAQVFGTVVTADSKPVAGAQVWVRQIIPPEATEEPESRVNDFFTSAPLANWSATTDANGSFRIADVPARARIQLFVSHGDFAQRLVYVKPDTQPEIKVQPGAVIAGTVLYAATEAPAAGVRVRASGLDRKSWARTITDERGQYRLESLNGGKYHVWVEAGDLTAVALDSFEVRAGREHWAPDLHLIEGGFVAGQVFDERTRKPVRPGPTASAWINGPSRPKGTGAIVTRIREDGSFRIRVAPGLNHLQIRLDRTWQLGKTWEGSPSVSPLSLQVNVSDEETTELAFVVRELSQEEIEAKEKAEEERRKKFITIFPIPKTIDELGQAGSRMKKLGLALAVYASEHDDTLPDTLVQLKDYAGSEQNLRWLVDNIHYFGEGKLALRDAAPAPIAYDKILLDESHGTYVLFLDFSVRFVERRNLGELGVDIRPQRSSRSPDKWIVLNTAMKMYARDHDGKLPETFDALKPYVVSERDLEWISSTLKWMAPGRHLGLMQSWAPIACEKEQFEKDQFTAVLFSDGRRESMYSKEIRKLAQLDRRSKKSAEILMRIGRAMLIYANDHGDKYPERLDDMREHLRADELAWAGGRIEYLASGKTTAERPDAVTAYDAELMTEGKGTNVLFNDCHVEFAGPERLSELNISNAAVLIKIQIVTATDDFLKEMHLDPNSVPVGEVKGGHFGDGSVAEPNSQPFLLLLDDIDERIIRKAIKTREDAEVIATPQVVALHGKSASTFAGSNIPVMSTSEPNDPGEKPKLVVKYVDLGTS